jgi:hypothetical protein
LGAIGELPHNTSKDSAAGQHYSSMARWGSIALGSLTLPKLFGYKERSIYLESFLAHQALDERKSFTVDKPNFFQSALEQIACRVTCNAGFGLIYWRLSEVTEKQSRDRGEAHTLSTIFSS